jgi:hypothetical protein
MSEPALISPAVPRSDGIWAEQLDQQSQTVSWLWERLPGSRQRHSVDQGRSKTGTC